MSSFIRVSGLIDDVYYDFEKDQLIAFTVQCNNQTKVSIYENAVDAIVPGIIYDTLKEYSIENINSKIKLSGKFLEIIFEENTRKLLFYITANDLTYSEHPNINEAYKISKTNINNPISLDKSDCNNFSSFYLQNDNGVDRYIFNENLK